MATDDLTVPQPPEPPDRPSVPLRAGRKTVLARVVAGVDSLEPEIERMRAELGGIGCLSVQAIGPISKAGGALVDHGGRPQAVLGLLVVAVAPD